MTEHVSPPRDAASWQTPLYEQYWKIKDSAPGTILFFRLGDFYELFGEDAIKAAPLMQVQLTSRDKSDTPIPMCGVPYHAWESYADKLLSHGISIAIADQMEPAGTKKLVERALVRIITPGLPIDPSRMSSKEYHYLAVLSQNAEQGEVILFDFLARRLFQGNFETKEELAEILNVSNPKEVLISSEVDTKLFENLKRFEKKLFVWGRGNALSLLKDYLGYTQRWSAPEVEAYLPEAKSLKEFSSSAKEVILTKQVREQWDIHPHLENLLDVCGSAGGSRELRELLSKPLLKSEHIRARQKLLEVLPVREYLSYTTELYDLERLIGRILIRASKPYELMRMRDSLQVIKKIDHFFQQDWSKALLPLKEMDELPDWNEIRETLLSMEEVFSKTLVQEATLQSDSRDLICAGVDAEFDRLKNLYSNLETWLSEFEEKLKTETGINNLKLRFNRVAGFYIEVSKAQSAKVPSYFERRQTLVNAERYTHPELKAREEEILGAEDKLERRANEMLEALSEKIRQHANLFLRASKIISYLDALAGAERAIQKLSAYGKWVNPLVEDGPFSFEMVEGRHPIIESIERSFVPNSLTLGRGKKRILLLTGPNMAGKSTLMRQTGLILVMAQVGLRVPVEKCELSPARGFYSRMGASDNILMGESTFMVEMKEMAYLLREADENSFVLMDEVGRGTSTKDGLALAKAFLEYLALHSPSLTLFATHYHELAPFSEAFDNVLNASMSIKEWKGDLLFLRKLVPEAASSSYGLHVAKLAGINSKILNRAKHFHNQSHSQNEKHTNRDEITEMPLFSLKKEISPKSEWRERMEEVRLDDLSPREAWKLLEKWKNESTGDDASDRLFNASRDTAEC